MCRGFIIFFFIFFAVELWAGDLPKLPPPELGSVPYEPSGSGGETAGGEGGLGLLPSVMIKTSLSRPEIHVGETVEYLVEVSFEKVSGSCEIEFDFPDVQLGEGFKAIGSSFQARNILEKGEERVLRSYYYQYLAEREGRSEFGPVKVNYRCIGSGSTKEVSAPLVVVEVLPKKLGLRDVVSSVYFRIGLGLLFVFSLSFLGWIYLKERRLKGVKEKEGEPLVEERYFSLLKENERYRIAGEYVEYFSGLERILRSYLEERFSISVVRLSKERLKEELMKLFGEEVSRDYERLAFILAEVKFASYKPLSEEMDFCMNFIKGLILKGEKRLIGAEEVKNG